MTTFQAVCIEALFQYFTAIFLLSVVIVSGPFVSSTTSNGMASAALGGMTFPSLLQLHKPSSSILITAMNQLYIIHGALFTSGADNMNYSLASSPTPGVSLALKYGMRQYPYSSESDGVRNLAAGVPTISPELMASLQRLIKEYSFVVFLAVFILAFVIAAGVEETLKHFIVRCCPFTRPIKDPSAVLGMTHPITVIITVSLLFLLACEITLHLYMRMCIHYDYRIKYLLSHSCS